MKTETKPKWVHMPTLAKRLAVCDASVRDLAELAGVPPSTISRIHRGLFKNPTQATLLKVDKAVSAWNRKCRAKALAEAMPATVGRRKD